MKEYKYSRSYNKHPDGYYPKLTYWNTVLKMAIVQEDTEGVIRATNKLQYFAHRQLERDYLEQQADSQLAISQDEGEGWETY